MTALYFSVEMGYPLPAKKKNRSSAPCCYAAALVLRLGRRRARSPPAACRPYEVRSQTMHANEAVARLQLTATAATRKSGPAGETYPLTMAQARLVGRLFGDDGKGVRVTALSGSLGRARIRRSYTWLLKESPEFVRFVNLRPRVADLACGAPQAGHPGQREEPDGECSDVPGARRRTTTASCRTSIRSSARRTPRMDCPRRPIRRSRPTRT